MEDKFKIKTGDAYYCKRDLHNDMASFHAGNIYRSNKNGHITGDNDKDCCCFDDKTLEGHFVRFKDVYIDSFMHAYPIGANVYAIDRDIDDALTLYRGKVTNIFCDAKDNKVEYTLSGKFGTRRISESQMFETLEEAKDYLF